MTVILKKINVIYVNPFAIIILSYNHPDLTSRCIDSVLKLISNQTVFLLHNGSLKKHSDQLLKNYPQITHLFLETNKGYTGGANFALTEAFKKYNTVLFLTNDTEILQLPQNIPTEFSSVKSYKRQTEQIDSIGGLIDIKKGKLLHRKNKTDIFESQQFIPYIPGTAFWLTKSIFESLCGFDETFHTYWDDVDLSYRAILKNIKLSHSDDTVIKHKIGKTCHKDSFYTYYLYQRNRKKFMQKHGLTTLRFWLLFYKDLLKNVKSRYKTTWNILND